MMEAILVLVEVLSFILLVWVYHRLCTDRKTSLIGKVVELISLYSISVWAILGNLKFTVWLFGVALIGAVKILTTKKVSVGRQNKGIIS